MIFKNSISSNFPAIMLKTLETLKHFKIFMKRFIFSKFYETLQPYMQRCIGVFIPQSAWPVRGCGQNIHKSEGDRQSKIGQKTDVFFCPILHCLSPLLLCIFCPHRSGRQRYKYTIRVPSHVGAKCKAENEQPISEKLIDFFLLKGVL